MKRLLSLFLLMYVGLSAMASAVSVKNADGVDIWYNFDSSTKTASVTRSGSGAVYSGNVVIPSTVTYDGVEYSVTSIGGSAFYGCDSLTSITLPEGLTSIGDDAFYNCSGLTSITLPESVTEIGDDAFCKCEALTSITLSESLMSIGDCAFYICDNLRVVINKSDLSITVGSKDNGYVAYNASIVYTNSEGESKLKTVGDYIFYADGDAVELIAYTGSETSITLPSDYEGKNYNIGDYAFYNCDALTSITLPEGVTSIGEKAFYSCNALTCITLPESLTSIGDYAFYYCSSLTSITLPESLTSIGKSAFYICDNLVVVINKSDLTIIAGSSDNGYVAEYARIVTDSEGESKIKTVEDYFFYADGDAVELIAYTGNVVDTLTLPSDYEGKSYGIRERAFYECDDLRSITIPESVTSIGKYAFYDCDALTSITLTEGLTSIGDYAFRSCTALTSITLPESLTSIGDYAFSYCNKLWVVNNKSDLTIIAGTDYNGDVAKNARIVTDGEVEGEVKTVGDYHFYVAGNNIKLLAYTGKERSITLPSDYEGKGYGIAIQAFYDCDFLTSITIPEGVTSIGGHAFDNCGFLTSITIPEGVTSIGYRAFYSCGALTSITLPESLTSIEDQAFNYCYKLWVVNNKSDLTIIAGSRGNGDVAEYAKIVTDGEVEGEVKKVGDYHFYVAGNNIKLLAYTGKESSITLPSDYEGKSYGIGERAFCECDALISITISEGVTSIGKYAFYDCDALTSTTISEGVTSIGDSAFYNCSALTSITLPEGLTLIGKSAFRSCNALTSITLPEGVTSIGDDAFAFCSSLTSITLPEGVTSIGDYAFYNCDALTSITSKNTTPPTVGGSYAFHNVDKTIPVYVPKSSVEAYESAKYWKDFDIYGKYLVVNITAENGTVEGAGAYEENAEVTLTVTPAEGYKFVKWSDSKTDNPRTIVVVSDMTLTAVFELKEYTVAVTAKNGTVEGVGTYKHGAEATLIVTPIEGYKFVKWSDGVTDNSRTIEVTSDLKLTAEIYKLCSVYATTENGFISGAGEYVDGDEVTLTATPFDGYEFFMWRDKYGNAVSFDANYTFTVTSDVELTAVFKEDDNPISDIQTSDVNVRLIGNRVVVEGADDYTVYSINGQNLGKVERVESGIYIVVVNGKSYKVVAK